MYSPHTVTLINTLELDNGACITNITYLQGVLLDCHAGGTVLKSGLQTDDNATLYIPVSVRAVDPLTGQIKRYVQAAKFDTHPDCNLYWTLRAGGNNSAHDCYFVKGELDVREITDYNVLRKNCPDVFRVSHFDFRDYGNPRLHHWEVGGK